MTDCPNGELRDALPEFVHDQLRAAARVRVEAHLASCADCRAEVEVLRNARRAFAAVVPVDVGRITRAVSPGPPPADHPLVSRHRTSPWRVAATVAMLLGGTSLVVGRRGGQHARDDGSGAAAVAPGGRVAGAVTTPSVGGAGAGRSDGFPAGEAVAGSGRIAELSLVGGLADLTESDLQTLLGEIGRLGDLPAEDPDAFAAVQLSPEG